MKFETWKKDQKRSGIEKLHNGLTTPVVPDLIDMRKKWNEEFEEKQKQRKKALLDAHKSGKLIFFKNK